MPMQLSHRSKGKLYKRLAKMVEHNFTEAEQHHRHSYAHYRGSSKVHMQASTKYQENALVLWAFYAFIIQTLLI